MIAKINVMIGSDALRAYINRFVVLGLGVTLLLVLLATIVSSYKTMGSVSLYGMYVAQTTNPLLWALDVVPILFVFWAYFFVVGFAKEAVAVIEEQSQEFMNKRGDLESTLHFKSFHDSLTSLPNYQMLLQRITQGIDKLDADDNLVVIIVRINSFKDINYKFDSITANNVLVQFAERLKEILLESFMLQPNMGMNMIARVQGAEFAILIPKLRNEHDFSEILQRISDMTQIDILVDDKNIGISTTIGAVICPTNGENEEALLHRAYTSLQWAEKENRSYAVYTRDLSKR